jgi:cell wall assembly regulator SMI1
MTDDIESLWHRIDAALARCAPAVRESLAGPAREKDLAALEKDLGVALPEDLRRSWSVHDGQGEDAEDAALFCDFPFHSVATVREARKETRELAKMLGQLKQVDDPVAWAAMVADGIGFVEGPVKARDYNPLWVPISSFNGDVFRYIDLDPAPGGERGQVIEVDPEAVSWRVLAPSFGALLARYAEALEAGRINWDDPGDAGSGALFPAGEPGMPEYLRGHLVDKEEDAPTAAPSGSVAALQDGERIEVDAEITRMIGGDGTLDARLVVAGTDEVVWAQADAETVGYKQVTMRAKGRATLIRRRGKTDPDTDPIEFMIERFSLRRAKK